MDSLTHIVLGAAIGEVTLGKKIGNKALLYGAFLGTIPDLDVFITPFLNPVSSLFFHRGISHSLLFLVFIAPIVGWILSKIEKKHSIELKEWILFSLFPLLSHIFIDCFNTYGTGIFEPFSNIRIAYDTMAIIDFIFLAPLTIAVIWVMFYQKQDRIRRIIMWIGLGLSTAYFFFTIVNKIDIELKIKKQLASSNIQYNRLLTTPAPLSNFLWLIVAENDNGYNIGYYYPIKNNDVKFNFQARNSELLDSLLEDKNLLNLLRFTKGFYIVEKDISGSLWLYDIRYCGLDFEDTNSHVFSFKLKQNLTSVDISRAHPNRKINLKTIINYFAKVF
ncbi:MAG: metal-dependent hydrolase [Bacteroidales bacterium]|nr:metal-dependent hydrolase [Bacteroidales bacterium]